jgi:predicted metal-dependent hydrolase
MINYDLFENVITWPPHFTLRKSRRAKRIHLKVTPNVGLEIVVPHVPRKPEVIHNLLHENRKWIEHTLEKYGMPNGRPPRLPKVEHLHFHAFNETWQVKYLSTEQNNNILVNNNNIISCNNNNIMTDDNENIAQGQHNKIKIRKTAHNQITLQGAIDNTPLYQYTLRKWLNKRGKQLLLPLLKQISEECQLEYHSASVRYQSTRWGSCSPKKVISLNHKLLFLPAAVTRYVIIHELCHTVHLNHSKRFWSLVAKFVPNLNEHRRELRDTRRFIPAILS